MEVVMFSTQCPKCKVLQKKLDDAGVSYTENCDVDAMMERGIRQAPMLLVGDELMDFTRAIAWVRQQEV